MPSKTLSKARPGDEQCADRHEASDRALAMQIMSGSSPQCSMREEPPRASDARLDLVADE